MIYCSLYMCQVWSKIPTANAFSELGSIETPTPLERQRLNQLSVNLHDVHFSP